MRLWRIGFVGFGNVNRALLRLLEERRAELRARHGLEFRVTLVASRRRGTRMDEAGLWAEEILHGAWSGNAGTLQAIREAPVDLVFEGTTLDPTSPRRWRREHSRGHVKCC